MRVLVTGGAGFLGSHLCDALLAEGHKVVCVDDLSTGSEKNIKRARLSNNFTFSRQDVSQGLRVSGPLSAVLHLASPASPKDFVRVPIKILRAGSLGTINALELACKHSARFIFASTSEVYGDPEEHPQNESYRGRVNPVGPRSSYDEAKRFGEAVVKAYIDTRGVDAAIIRIFNTYGPRMHPSDGRVVPTFLRQAIEGMPLTVIGDGQQTRSLQYVDDFVEAMLKIMRTKVSGPINIGNPQEISVENLARLIAELTESPSQVLFAEPKAEDPRVRCPDIQLAIEQIGWKPVVSLREGLLRTIAALQEQDS